LSTDVPRGVAGTSSKTVEVPHDRRILRQCADATGSVDRLVSSMSTKLAHDGAQIALHGFRTDAHFLRGFDVRVAEGDAGQNVQLAGGQLSGLLDADRGDHLGTQGLQIAAESLVLHAAS